VNGKNRAATRPQIYRWLLTAASLLLMLGVAEITLQWLSPDTYHVWPPRLESRFEPLADVMPGVEGVSLFSINDIGLRGRNPGADDRLSMLAIGGSTTECLYLDDREAWPRLLEEKLNARTSRVKTWIGNAGRSGHTTRNHVLQAEKMLGQYPEIDVLIMMIGVNDFALRLRRDTGFLPLQQESRGYRQKLFYRSFAAIPPMAQELPMLKRLALWQWTRVLKKRIQHRYDLIEVETATGRVYVDRRRERAAAKEIRETLPDLSSSLAEFGSNLRTIVDRADRDGVRVVLLTQPAMWGPDLSPELAGLLWFGAVGETRDGSPATYYSIGALAEGMARYNREVLEICMQTSAVCIDVAAALARDTSVFYDDVHFNEAGARQVAELVARGLERAGIVSPRADRAPF
jgi:lysophospholipase L1-like esterase